MAIPTNVDPYKIPKSMTREQLEWWILFGICVANKPAKITEAKLKTFLNTPILKGEANIPNALAWCRSPFAAVKLMDKLGELEKLIKLARFGQYGRITGAFRGAVTLDLNNLSVPSLEAIKGIGPKTARMIMLYYDPEANCVPLDTHVLKFLKTKGYDVPKATPSAGKKYNELEKAFQEEARKAGKTVRELDTEVWLSYAKQ